MKFISGKEFVICAILLLSIEQIDPANALRRRRDATSNDQVDDGSPNAMSTPAPAMPTNDLSLSDLGDSLGKIPLIGPLLKAAMDYVAESIITSNRLTNGVLARALGGSLPCVIDIDKGIVCSGASRNGGVFGIFEGLVNGLMLPEIFKMIILDSIRIMVNPVVDTLFGGQPKLR